MKKRVVQISLVIAICSLFLALPASFLRNANLSMISPFFAVLSFENSDQDDPFRDSHSGSDAFLSSVIPVEIPSGTNPFTGIRYVSFFPAFLGQGTFTPRC